MHQPACGVPLRKHGRSLRTITAFADESLHKHWESALPDTALPGAAPRGRRPLRIVSTAVRAAEVNCAGLTDASTFSGVGATDKPGACVDAPVFARGFSDGFGQLGASIGRIRPLVVAYATGPVCSSRNRVHIGSESRVLPPVDRCFGTSPSQAAKFLPLEKARRSGAKARPAPALIGRTPGTVQRRRISAFSRVASLCPHASLSLATRA